MTDRPSFRLLPQPTARSGAFWTGGENGHLLVYRCRACGRWFHPPAPACFRCRSRDVGPEAISGRATVAAFTINHHQWFEGFPPPYVVAIVELDARPDVRLTTQIVNYPADEVRVGLPVEVVFERWEDAEGVVWPPLFRPVLT
jgi:uncharacterized OB-fold protein